MNGNDMASQRVAAAPMAPPLPGIARRGDGIYTVDDLKDRCVIDEITGCWLWRGAKDSHHAPALWLPALRRRTTLGVAICMLTTGDRPAPGAVWHCTCETRHCANPAHRCQGDRATQMRAARIKKTPEQRVRMAAAARAAGKLSEADAHAIRTCGLSLIEIAQRWCISVGYACEVRSGKRRAPLAAPSSSVFAWRPS